MTRYFQHEYMEAEYFLNVESAEVFFDSQMKADGKVITLFSRKAIQQDAVIEKVEELRRKNLVVVVPEKKISCEKELVEYEILQDIRKNSFLSINSDIAKREIPLLEEDIIDTVRNRCTEVYLEDKNCKTKIFSTARGYGEFKGGWEFPGGKIEAGETPQQAVVREIREELDATVRVGDLIDTIEYDYPAFHLSMDCFWCEVASGELKLLEAEAARWLTKEELDSVQWLPADVTLIDKIKSCMA